MYICEINIDEFGSEIKEARQEILSGWGVNVTSNFTDPLPFAYYLGLFSDDQRRRLIGFSEYYLYRDLDDGYNSSPISTHFNLNEICGVAELGNIRTIYLKPQYRRSFNSYVKLYIATAKHGIELGIKYTTFSTSSKDSYLQRVYRKMGGKVICSFDIPNLMEGIDIFLLDLDDLVNQPMAIRFGSE